MQSKYETKWEIKIQNTLNHHKMMCFSYGTDGAYSVTPVPFNALMEQVDFHLGDPGKKCKQHVHLHYLPHILYWPHECLQ